MKELSLHILDIVENSVKAKASLVIISITVKDGFLFIEITDNGIGMEQEFLSKVLDPFVTTRTTRKVGLGLPLFKQLAEATDGEFFIQSKKGVGTVVKASFRLNHIDLVPLGDVPSTIVTLIQPQVDIVLNYTVLERSFEFDTRAIKEQLDGVPIDSPEILVFLGEYLKENIELTNGGLDL